MTTNSPYDGPLIRFHFQNDSDPVLILTPKGFIYKGETIEDAGEAHRLWISVMEKVAHG